MTYDQIMNTLYILIGVSFVLILIGFPSIYYYMKKRKPKTDEYDSSVYSSFNRLDAKDYIKIDDILDDVIVANNWQRFIGVIDCAGIDFFAMSAPEQLNVAGGYMSFVNTIDGPITLRQYCMTADNDDILQDYDKVLSEVYASIQNVCMQIDELNSKLEHLSDKEIPFYNAKMEELDKALNVLEFRKFHILDQIDYVSMYSGTDAVPLQVQTYVFDWDVSAIEGFAQLSKYERLAKAKVELNSIAQNKIHALAATGVVGRRCTTDELIDMFRKHSLPVSSERFKKVDLKKIDYDSDIISSDYVAQYKKTITDYRKMLMREQTREMLVSSHSDVAPTLENGGISVGNNTAVSQETEELVF